MQTNSPQPVVPLLEQIEVDAIQLMSEDQRRTFERALTEREALEVNMEKLLDLIAFEKRPCRECGVTIRAVYFRQAVTSRNVGVALNYDGSQHAQTCKAIKKVGAA